MTVVGVNDYLGLPLDNNGKKAVAFKQVVSGQDRYVSGVALVDASNNRLDIVPVDMTRGYSTKKLVSATGTNITLVKASAGTVYGWYLSNTNAAARYLKLYNVSSAPTVGTTVPTQTLMIPAGGAANVAIPGGIAFTTGIYMALTSGAADNDSGTVAASEIIVNLFYL